jgi:hypothetical protein
MAAQGAYSDRVYRAKREFSCDCRAYFSRIQEIPICPVLNSIRRVLNY